MSTVAPRIYNYRNVTAREGESATLVCFSEGDPTPDVTFRKTTLDHDYVVGENVSVCDFTSGVCNGYIFGCRLMRKRQAWHIDVTYDKKYRE